MNFDVKPICWDIRKSNVCVPSDLVQSRICPLRMRTVWVKGLTFIHVHYLHLHHLVRHHLHHHGRRPNRRLRFIDNELVVSVLIVINKIPILEIYQPIWRMFQCHLWVWVRDHRGCWVDFLYIHKCWLDGWINLFI